MNYNKEAEEINISKVKNREYVDILLYKLIFLLEINNIENNKLENVYFNMYKSKLKLDESGYAEVPDKIRFKIFFNRWVYNRTNLSIFKFKFA